MYNISNEKHTQSRLVFDATGTATEQVFLFHTVQSPIISKLIRNIPTKPA